MGKAIVAPSKENFRNVGLDGVGLLPIVPSAGMVRRLDDVVDAAKLASMRTEFDRVVKPAFWRNEAAQRASTYSAENLARMQRGRPPIGPDGFPMELHHQNPLAHGGSNEFSNLKAMTRTEHRLGPNFKRNHP